MAIEIRTNFFPPVDQAKMYFVYIIYDKYVSWEFCVKTLMSVFHKNQEEAMRIADEITTEGEGLCGVYLFDIAESKAELVESKAKDEGFSLRCLVEEV